MPFSDDVPDDAVPRGLVFASLDDAPARRRRRVVLISVVVAALLALTWPVYPLVSGVEPYVFGFPLSFAWVIGWLLVVFVALVLFYRAEESGEESGDDAPSP